MDLSKRLSSDYPQRKLPCRDWYIPETWLLYYK